MRIFEEGSSSSVLVLGSIDTQQRLTGSKDPSLRTSSVVRSFMTRQDRLDVGETWECGLALSLRQD